MLRFADPADVIFLGPGLLIGKACKSCLLFFISVLRLRFNALLLKIPFHHFSTLYGVLESYFILNHLHSSS